MKSTNKNHIKNGNFEDGWEDVGAEVGHLANQRPWDWELDWLDIGQPLYDNSDTLAGGVPEYFHCKNEELPPDQRFGAKNAHILDGSTAYIIANDYAPFGAELYQEVNGLPAGATFRLTVSVLAVLYGDSAPWSAEAGVWVNTTGRKGGASRDWTGAWANGQEMGDRRWHEHVVDFVVPPTGTVEVIIRVKSKRDTFKDFFIDNVRLEEVLQ